MKTSTYMQIIFGITFLITSIIGCKKDLVPDPKASEQAVTIIDTTKKTLTVTPKDTSKTTPVVVPKDTSKTTPVVVPKDTTKPVVIPPSQTLAANRLKTFASLAGGIDYFAITSNTNWKIASYPNWLTVSPLSGTGNAQVTVTVQANAGAQRTGAITLSGTGVSKSVTINAIQAAAPVVAPLPGETVYNFPFTALGFSIINKKMIGGTSATGNLISASNQAFDIENSYLEGGNTNVTSLFSVSGATSPKVVKVLNNVLQFTNPHGYTCLVGTDSPPATNGYYNGAQFIGNSLTGKGIIGQSGCNAHGLFLSFSSGGTWMYNFVNGSPYGIHTKANGMDNTNGIMSYNLIKNARQCISIKGEQNTKIYNNTFYLDNTVLTYAACIVLTTYDDGTAPATGTQIKNNIFYSTGTTPYMIQVHEAASLSGLQCDYNVYYVKGGSPIFIVNGSPDKYYSFAQWQALGYDTHSVVIDPHLDPTTLIPASAIQHAANLGSGYNTGIDPSNTWQRKSTITKAQGSTWQNGAYIK